MQTQRTTWPRGPRPRPSRERPPIGHPEAYAALARDPRRRTGMEICRADLLHETGDCPPPGPWSACSAAAGLTEAYLAHLSASEPHGDPEAEACLAYVVEQFFLSRESGAAAHVPLPVPVPSRHPGRPYVSAYVDARLPRAAPDDLNTYASLRISLRFSLGLV